MRIFIKIMTIIITLMVLLIVAATQFISTEEVFNQVSVKVEEATGRVISVDGEKQLSFFPSLSIVLNGVRFANAEGGSKPDMATVDKLHIHIPWLSILSGELTIAKFVMINPDVLLETSTERKPNWQFSLAQTNAAEQRIDQDASKADTAVMTLPEAFDISLGQVEIKGGKLTFIDHTNKTTKTIDQLNLAVFLPSLRQALSVSGSVRYMAQTFELEVNVATPADVINNQPFSVKLALTSALANISYEGTILKQGQDIKGTLSVSADSVKRLLKWQNISLGANKEAFNQFSLTTRMHFANNKLALNKLSVELDKLAFTGSSAITLSEPLAINADIDLGILNLNPYLPQNTKVGQVNSDTAIDVSTKSEPLVWDDSDVDLSALSLVNADIAIQSTQLLVRKIKLGENKLTLKLNNGIVAVQLLDFKAYEGSGSGTINVVANKKPYQLTSQFELTKINAQPLLTDAAGFDKLLGKGQLAWDISSQGTSQKNFVNQLNGKFNFSFVDGAVKGVNLAAIAKSANNIMSGNLAKVNLDSDFSNAEKTDFAALTGTFNIRNGLANTGDLSMNNPFIRVSGTGDINLPKTKVNMLVITKMVASLQGQAAQETSSGIKIPIKISGPFDKIKIRPDVSSEAKDKLKDKVKDKLKKWFG